MFQRGLLSQFKTFSRALALLVPSILLTVPAFADSIAKMSDAEIVRDFRANAKILAKQIRDNGDVQIGDLNMNTFIESVDHIDVRIVKDVAHLQKEGPFDFERNSAEWKRLGHGRIKINGPRWIDTKSKFKPMLSTHESLGALGIMDDDFSCSASLWTMANKDMRATLKANEMSQISEFAGISCMAASGGSTGVTGGGDENNVRAKIWILEEGLKDMKASRNADERDEGFQRIGRAFTITVERNRDFKYKGSIFDPENPYTQMVLPKRTEEKYIKVWLDGKPVPKSSKNGWTFNPRANALIFHGSYIRGGFPQFSVLY